MRCSTPVGGLENQDKECFDSECDLTVIESIDLTDVCTALLELNVLQKPEAENEKKQ